MAHISKHAVKEQVQGVGASTAFSVSPADRPPLPGFKNFGDVMANADTCIYKASDANGNWEIGLGTYTSATKILTRTTVIESSAANGTDAIDFSTKGTIYLEMQRGLQVGEAAYTITSFSADRTFAGNEGTAANISATLATLIRDLITAGILRGTVA
jgi:hypothetical protein